MGEKKKSEKLDEAIQAANTLIEKLHAAGAAEVTLRAVDDVRTGLRLEWQSAVAWEADNKRPYYGG